jgi:hypothetical protein
MPAHHRTVRATWRAKDGETWTIVDSRPSAKLREPQDYTLKRGQRCVVQPLQWNRGMHRGRRCIFVRMRLAGRSESGEQLTFRAFVQFEDDSTYGNIRIGDLVPADLAAQYPELNGDRG